MIAALQQVGLFVAYVVAGKLGLLLASVHASATPVWPPTGIALAALLLFGLRLWPAIFAGAFVVNVTTAGSVATSLAIAAGNTLEAVLGAALVARYAGGARVFERADWIFRFTFLAAVVSTAVAATVGVTSLAIAGYAEWTQYARIWSTWWLGDAAAAMIVTPLLVLWTPGKGERSQGSPGTNPWRVVEGTALLLIVLGVGVLVFGGHAAPLAFLCLAPLVWAAFRFGPRMAVTAVAALTAVAIAGTLRGVGPFGAQPPNDSLLFLQAFMATLAMVTLPTAAVVRQWRRAGEALRRDEQRFRELAQTVPVMVWLAGPDTRCTFFNDAWLQFTGRPLAEELGEGWRAGVHPEDASRCVERYRAAFAARTTLEHEYRLRRADGAWRVVLSRGVPRFDADGVFQGFVGGAIDIHDRKRAERRLRAQHAASGLLASAGSLAEASRGILESLGDALGWPVGAAWWVERGGAVIRCGDTWHAPSVDVPEFLAVTRAAVFERGVGLPGRVWATGRPAWIPDVMAETNFPRASVALRAGLHAAFAFPVHVDKLVVGIIEFFLREPAEPDDELLDVATSVGGQLGQFAERKRAEAQVEEASRVKDEFLATLSHELRTPLNAIVGWAQLLRDRSVEDATVRKAVEVIDRNARAQVQIIEDLLDVSRIITGQLRVDRQPVDLGAVVEQSLDVVRPAADARGIVLHVALDQRLPPVLGDPQRLQQIAWNLLSNAVKFTPPGGRVEVRLTRTPQAAVLSVTDTGPGIDAAFLPYIFDRFRQADSTTTRSHGGLGLGLAIVRHLVELHGGTVRAENRGDGEGAVFTVTLPLGAPRAADPGLPSPPARADETSAGLRAGLHGIHVLVVDDDPDTVELARSVLAAAGATAATARSAREALAALAARRPDVLLCDVGMPGEDGYALIRRIRALPDTAAAGVPAIALTAYAGAGDRRRAYEAGFDRHLAKPVRPGDLVDAVALLAARPR